MRRLLPEEREEPMPIEIRAWDFRNATAKEAAAFNSCSNQIRAECLPDEPLIPVEETIQLLSSFARFLRMHN